MDRNVRCGGGRVGCTVGGGDVKVLVLVCLVGGGVS